MQIRFLLIFVITLSVSLVSSAQKKDSSMARGIRVDTATAQRSNTDSASKKKHDPHKATMHSLILPGWGQAYNRKYWKIPIVYGALGVTGVIFNFNRVQYNHVKFAYFALINKDSAKYTQISDPALRRFVYAGDAYSLQLYRNEYRKNVDYSVLFFLFFWALNVVDATVDGHLKDFDVSNDLSMKIKPAINTLPNSIGLSMVMTIGKHPSRKQPYFVP